MLKCPTTGHWHIPVWQPLCATSSGPRLLDRPTRSPQVQVGAWRPCPSGLCLQAPLSHSQPPALSQLVSLYLGRSHFLWKEPATMSWLEENVREVLQAVDSGDPAVEACESRWAWR